jgi:NAD dependent epimerase/dehydratase family enzyme
MDVAVTGASGLIGTALCRSLASDGHRVLPLVRRSPDTADEIQWDPAAGLLDPGALEGIDAVVHLAGAGIADKRWTEARKGEILESRTRGTSLLAGALAKLERPPAVFVSGSAVGYYGDGGDTVLTEQS